MRLGIIVLEKETEKRMAFVRAHPLLRMLMYVRDTPQCMHVPFLSRPPLDLTRIELRLLFGMLV
jgi:predicted FMN-binding regulatory protein PaiB